MSKREAWLVSVMVGFGRSAQFLMTEPMTYERANDTAERMVEDCEDGEWLKVGLTYANPSAITTIRVVKERDSHGPRTDDGTDRS